MKHNGSIWIAEGDRIVTRIDAAQYSMLTDLHSQDGQPSPSVQLLQLISASSRALQQSELEHHVHWSLHLPAYIWKVKGAQLLVGASAMTYNPHYHRLSKYHRQTTWCISHLASGTSTSPFEFVYALCQIRTPALGCNTCTWSVDFPENHTERSKC